MFADRREHIQDPGPACALTLLKAEGEEDNAATSQTHTYPRILQRQPCGVVRGTVEPES